MTVKTSISKSSTTVINVTKHEFLELLRARFPIIPPDGAIQVYGGGGGSIYTIQWTDYGKSEDV